MNIYYIHRSLEGKNLQKAWRTLPSALTAGIRCEVTGARSRSEESLAVHLAREPERPDLRIPGTFA